jgi:hypothetical protein
VQEESDEPVDVLIEVALPEARVETKKVVRGGVEIRVPASIAPTSEERNRESEGIVAESRRLLRENLRTSPRWLESACVFVATATPRQLRRIAQSPAIKAIWPNREIGPLTRFR